MKSKKKIIIGGGGIGGMAAGLALLRAGFDVEIYEQAKELGEVGAGIQVSPNGSRALDYLGVYEALREVSCAPERKEFRLWNTGDTWPMFDLGPVALEMYGYPYLTVYRPDLLSALINGVRAIKPDAIHLGCPVAGITQNEDSASLILADGREITGDIVIGADGVKSTIRNALWGPDNPTFAGMIAWRSVIPMKNLPAHMQKMVGSTWIGPGGHAVNYPLRGGELMNFIGTVHRDDWQIESWNIEGDVEECVRDYAGWHPDVHAMIRSADKILKWAFMGRDPMQAWSIGRISLLGDACHPTLPFLAQGAVMSIEDGVVLARCLEKYDDIPEALLKYENARIERTTKMVLGARENTDRFHSAELVNKESADIYLAKEMGANPIHDRYHWLYIYDAANVDI